MPLNAVSLTLSVTNKCYLFEITEKLIKNVMWDISLQLSSHRWTVRWDFSMAKLWLSVCEDGSVFHCRYIKLNSIFWIRLAHWTRKFQISRRRKCELVYNIYEEGNTSIIIALTRQKQRMWICTNIKQWKSIKVETHFCITLIL